jgi:hypothetical protein
MASTKASEIIHYFTVSDVSLNSSQNLDPNEEIEVLTLTPQEIDNAIVDGSIWCALLSAAGIYLNQNILTYFNLYSS